MLEGKQGIQTDLFHKYLLQYKRESQYKSKEETVLLYQSCWKAPVLHRVRYHTCQTWKALHSGSCVVSSLAMLDAMHTVYQVLHSKIGSHLCITSKFGCLSYISEQPKVYIRSSDIYKDDAPEVIVPTRHWPITRADPTASSKAASSQFLAFSFPFHFLVLDSSDTSFFHMCPLFFNFAFGKQQLTRE